MKHTFSARFLVILTVLVIICLGTAIYTGSTGKSSPLTNAIGVVISPIQKGVTKISDMIKQGAGYFEEYDSLRQENEELKSKVSELEKSLRDSQQLKEQNEQLRTLLEIKENNPQYTTCESAEVIARNPGEWSTTLSLDKGTRDGVELYDTVITDDGMVGYVSSVSLTYCDVTTIIDPNIQVGAIVSRSREVGIAEGDYTMMNENTLRVSYLETDADIVIGDTVETSGAGGKFPKGVIIGIVERILPEENGISNYAVIRPSVNVDDIKSVYIITDYEGN